MDRKSAVFTLPQVQEALQISRATAYRMMENGTLPRVPGLGRAVRIPAAAVERLVNAGQPVVNDHSHEAAS